MFTVIFFHSNLFDNCWGIKIYSKLSSLYWFSKINPVLNDKLIGQQSFWFLNQFLQMGIDDGTWFLKFTIIFNEMEYQIVKRYKKLYQILCLVFSFHTIRLLDFQQYVMWVFQKDHAAAKIPCNWALLYM